MQDEIVFIIRKPKENLLFVQEFPYDEFPKLLSYNNQNYPHIHSIDMLEVSYFSLDINSYIISIQAHTIVNLQSLHLLCLRICH